MSERKKEVVVCLLLAGLALLLILSLKPEGAVYGSMTDWINQHSVLPDYFRDLFHRTGNLFPDFAMELGGGQNSYHFSYYGLLNPVILFSYLLPNVPMTEYLAVTSLLLAVFDPVLFYLWIRGKNISRISAILAAICFLCAAPLLFHSHRHVMFVNYMPFLLAALIGMDEFLRKGGTRWIALFCMAVLCCCLSSYFFSVGCLAALGLYCIADWRSMGQAPGAKLWKLGAAVLLAVMMAGILLVPTALALISGRSGDAAGMAVVNHGMGLKALLFPRVNTEWLTGGAYTLGFSWIAPVSLAAGLMLRKGRQKVLPAALFMLLVIPVFSWLLNGTLYLRPKALIPFLPLYALMIAELSDWTWGWLARGLKSGDERLALRKCAPILAKALAGLLIVLVIVPSIQHCFLVNQGELWIKASDLSAMQVREKGRLLSEAEPGTEWFRTDDLTQTTATVNQTYGGAGKRSSVYSSVSNQHYNRFFYDVLGNAIPARNRTACAVTENIFSQTFFGVRRLITKEGAPAGYRKIAREGDLSLYENLEVLPVGWALGETMNQTQFLQLTHTEQLQALFESIVVDQGEGTEQMSLKSAETGEAEPLNSSQMRVENDDASWFHQLMGDELSAVFPGGVFPAPVPGKRVVVPLNISLKEKILLIGFDVTDRKSSKDMDINIYINGVKNKKSKQTAAYPNGNDHFYYVLSAEQPVDKLSIRFGKGDYAISGLEVYEMDRNRLIEAVRAVDRFEVDGDEAGGSRISGTIKTSGDGWFTVSIPYDKGFQITVDGAPQEYSRVNTAFLGFPLSAGDHRIVIEYHAPGKRVGAVLSVLGGLLSAAVCLFSWIRSRNPKRKKEQAALWLRKHWELGAYLVFGVLTTLVNWMVFQMLISLFGRSWAAANMTAWAAAVLFAYMSNRTLVFQSNSTGWHGIIGEFLRFMQSRVISLTAEMAGLFLLIQLAGIAAFPAKVAVAVLVVALNYLFSKIFVFREEGGVKNGSN